MGGCNDHDVTFSVTIRASNESYPKVREDFTFTEKAPTRTFFWLKALTSAFTFCI